MIFDKFAHVLRNGNKCIKSFAYLVAKINMYEV